MDTNIQEIIALYEASTPLGGILLEAPLSWGNIPWLSPSSPPQFLD